MNVENPALVTASVLFILTLVFLQSLGLGVALFFLGRQISSVQDRVTRLGGSVSKLLDQTDRLLASAELLHLKLPEGLQKFSSSLQWLNNRMDEVDGFAVRNLETLSDTLDKMAEKSDSLLSSFGSITYKIHRAVIQPARHVSAALSAIQESALWMFTRGRHKERDPVYPDEQSFI